MAIEIKSVADLELVLAQEVQKIFQKSEKDLIKEIQKSIDEVVYQAYTPTIRYDRSGDLKKTLKAKTYNTELIVDHDKSKAGWFSVKDGKKFTDVPEVVTGHTEDGKIAKYGTFKGEGIDAHGSNIHDIRPESWRAWARPRDYMQQAEENIEANGYQFIRKHLPSYATLID